MKDYVCVPAWDPELECMRFHWVHKSEKDPNQFVKNLNPTQDVFWTNIGWGRTTR